MHRVTVRERMGDHYENQILCEFVVAVCRNNIFEVDNSKSRGSVSYTHLDVYKRQALNSMKLACES